MFMAAWSAAYSALLPVKHNTRVTASSVLDNLGSDTNMRHTAQAMARHIPATAPPGYDSVLYQKHSVLGMLRTVFKFVWLRYVDGVSLVTYRVSPARLGALKAQATADLTSTSAPASSFDMKTLSHVKRSVGWVSTHDALVARVWQAVASLPGKDRSWVTLAVGIRQRVPPPHIPADTVGNCYWNVRVPGPELHASVQHATLGEAAAQVRAGIEGFSVEGCEREWGWMTEHVANHKTFMLSKGRVRTQRLVCDKELCVLANELHCMFCRWGRAAP
jgi:hypothetical protein